MGNTLEHPAVLTVELAQGRTTRLVDA